MDIDTVAQEDYCEDMGFRMAYKNLLQNHQLTTVFRLHSEKYSQLYPANRCVNGRIIAIPGNAQRNIAPVYDNFVVRMKVIDIRTLRMGDFKKEDFKGSSPDVYDIKSLKWHLALIYNKPVEHFDENTKIVAIELSYNE